MVTLPIVLRVGCVHVRMIHKLCLPNCFSCDKKVVHGSRTMLSCDLARWYPDLNILLSDALKGDTWLMVTSKKEKETDGVSIPSAGLYVIKTPM